MKIFVKNPSDDSYSFGNNLFAVGSNSTVEAPISLWSTLSSDVEFIKNIRNGNLVLNDGISDYKAAGGEALLLKVVDAATALVSPGNSTSSLLDASQTFVGVSEEVFRYSSISITMFSDTRGVLRVQWSDDSVIWRFDGDPIFLDSNLTKKVSLAPTAKYFRLLFSNGLVAQAQFSLQTIFNKVNKNSNVQQVSLTLADDGLSVAGDAISFVAGANTTTVYDFLLTEAFLFRGLSFLSPNAAFGDYIKIELVDKDNVLNGGANAIVKTPIKKAFVQNTVNSHPITAEDVSAAEIPTAGLYLRIHYTNTALLTGVDVFINLKLYRRD